MRRTLLSLGVVLLGAACRESAAPTAPVARDYAKVRTVANQAGSGALLEGICLRSTGKPVSDTLTFSGAGLEGATYTLEVEDNGVQGLNGTIQFNGETVVTHPMFRGNAPVQLLVPVTIATDNTVVCKLEGKPGSGVSIFVNP